MSDSTHDHPPDGPLTAQGDAAPQEQAAQEQAQAQAQEQDQAQAQAQKQAAGESSPAVAPSQAAAPGGQAQPKAKTKAKPKAQPASEPEARSEAKAKDEDGAKDEAATEAEVSGEAAAQGAPEAAPSAALPAGARAASVSGKGGKGSKPHGVKRPARRVSGERVQIQDPLLVERPALAKRLLGGAGLTVTSAIAHLIGGALLINFAPMCSPIHKPEEAREEISVAMVEEPSPQPIEEPPVVEEPTPEEPAPEEPTPKEPEPEPPPKPEPPKIKEPPPPKPVKVKEPPPPKETPPPPKEEPPASMKPVNLEGLTMDSTAVGGDFSIKVGAGINQGKITGKYVDPTKLDKIKTGDGDGSGTGTGTGVASVARPRECPVVEAKIDKKRSAPSSEYPAEAKRRGIEAEVIGLVTVNVSGQVTDVKIVKGAGYGFDEVAQKYFRLWTFKPAERDCQKVSVQVRVNYKFTISEY